MINRAVLTGRMTRDPELKYTGNGTAVASFTLAVNRKFANQQGEHEADFINCVAWRKTAEVLEKYTHKGSLVGVDGRIQTRSYDNQQGQKVYVTEIVVDDFTFLESKGQSTNDSHNNNQNNSEKAPFANDKAIEISEQQLPF